MKNKTLVLVALCIAVNIAPGAEFSPPIREMLN